MKAALYCRLSEEDKNKNSEKKDSASILNQKALLLKFADSRGWEVYGIYSDDDYTGSDRNRPEFKRLLLDAENRKFDIILCKNQSRFTRELELVEKYIHGLFPIWGIRFVSISDNADTENKGNKKSRQINGLVNEWYLEDMSENIKSVLDNKRENGYHIGSFALYGYKKDPEVKGHLIIDDQAADVVREVFRLFSCGYGKTAIARILNGRGIPNPAEYKRLNGLRFKNLKGKNSTLWKYPAISEMLINEMYIGNMVEGKYGSVSYKLKKNKPRPREKWFITEKTHEPVIDLNLWNEVQQILKSRARPFSDGKTGLFAGICRCKSCGYTMRSSKNRGRYYLRCSERYFSSNACEGSFISVSALEKAVFQEFRNLTEKFLDRETLLSLIKKNNGYALKIQDITADILLWESRIYECKKAMSELYIDKARGAVPEMEFSEILEDLSIKKALLIEECEKKKKNLCRLRKKADENDCRKFVDGYINEEELNRRIITKFIDHIDIKKRKEGTKEVEAEIYWSF